MGIAVFFSLSVLWFALAAWVYFDAAERDKPAILWAALILFSFFFLFIPIVLYPIFRDSGQRRFVPAGGGSRQYLYVAAFAGLTTLLTGLAIVVAAAVWAPHWFRTVPRLAQIADDQEFRATFHLHRVYVYTVLGIAGITLFLSGLWVIGGGLAQLLGVQSTDAIDWVLVLGPVVVALGVIAFHYLWVMGTPEHKEFQRRFDSIPPPAIIGGPTTAGRIWRRRWRAEA